MTGLPRLQSYQAFRLETSTNNALTTTKSQFLWYKAIGTRDGGNSSKESQYCEAGVGSGRRGHCLILVLCVMC